MIPADKGTKIEVNWLTVSNDYLDPAKVSDMTEKLKAQSIVTSKELVTNVLNIKSYRNAKYNVILEIDKFGKVFGPQKFMDAEKLQLQGIDGFDITLTGNKNKIELINEIKSIRVFLRPLGNIRIRWGINISNGSAYITNCLEAIRDSKDSFEMIKLIKPDAKTLTDLIKAIRIKIGKPAAKIKIPGNGDDFFDVTGLYYDINIADLDSIAQMKRQKARDKAKADAEAKLKKEQPPIPPA